MTVVSQFQFVVNQVVGGSFTNVSIGTKPNRAGKVAVEFGTNAHWMRRDRAIGVSYDLCREHGFRAVGKTNVAILLEAAKPQAVVVSDDNQWNNYNGNDHVVESTHQYDRCDNQGPDTIVHPDGKHVIKVGSDGVFVALDGRYQRTVDNFNTATDFYGIVNDWLAAHPAYSVC